jgi:hypothetical protein
MKRIIFLLFISSQSLFSQNTTTVNTKVNVMGMDIMDVQVQETNTTNSNSNQQQVGSVPQNQNNGGQSKPSSCTFPISGSEYGKVTASIKSQSFEETQLKIAKQATKANCMSTAQIKGICKMFSFEESKLEFAIFAHTYCTDKNNYYSLNDVFSYSASVDSLTDAIENKH